LIDNGNNLLLSPLREGDGKQKRTKRATKEKKKQASPPFRLPRPSSKKEKKENLGKNKKKKKKQNKTKQKRGGRGWEVETSVFFKKNLILISVPNHFFKKYSVEDSSLKSPYFYILFKE
jgi:hypothetical protein